MRNIQINNKIKGLLLIFAVLLIGSCERDLSDDAVLAGFSKEGDIFIDGPIALGSNFYFPYNGSKPDAVSFDGIDTYRGSASIRINVPNADDPEGNYAGAILRIDGAGRDLTGFDALTFYAKASQGVNLDAIGFGEDFIDNKYQATITNVSIGTGWNKYIVPIPDPSKLVEERGVFRYAAGTQATGGLGYTIWLDEIRFEKLGTLAHPRPQIQNGEDVIVDTFTGVELEVSGLTQTYNLGTGLDQTVVAAPSYFEFVSSNPGVASVDELGQITVNSGGTAIITAAIGGLEAVGSLTINSLGDFDLAPEPTRDPDNVISIFSDVYENVPVDFYNGYWEPFQTTLSADFAINGDNILNYTNFNFVGNQFANPTVDATGHSNLHLNMYIPGDVPSDFDFLISVVDFGDDGQDGGGDDTRQQIFVNSSDVVSNQWVTLEFPLTLANKDNLGLIIYENINGSSLSNFYLDNIYFYRDVLEPSPNVDDSMATEVAFPIGFESTSLVYDFVGFEGADSSIQPNPMATGINPTSTVMQSIKTVGAQFFAGTALNLDSPIDFLTSQKVRMKILSPKSGIPIKVRLEDQNNTAGIEIDASTTTSDEWEELEWDFSSVYNPSIDYVRIVVFFEFVVDLPGDGSTYYFDDIQIID
ncbi:Ig-like domain-containing protein [Hanstruepera flava]|uniref:Ig-like domain-containing protein n=1 Tax=Hanstruepera flava TaxID=2930218 RepID=UPI0020292CA9|nr:Ig-like domain-containing protein [Hanstruepera flava]